MIMWNDMLTSGALLQWASTNKIQVRPRWSSTKRTSSAHRNLTFARLDIAIKDNHPLTHIDDHYLIYLVLCNSLYLREDCCFSEQVLSKSN